MADRDSERIIRQLADDATFHKPGAYYLPDYGQIDQTIEEYRRLRSLGSRARYCRSLAFSLQEVDVLPRGMAAREQAAQCFRMYLDAVTA